MTEMLPSMKDIGLLLAWGGPGLVILVAIFSLIRRPPSFIGDFVKAQQDLAVSLHAMAGAVKEAVTRDDRRMVDFAVALQKMADATKEAVSRDDRRMDESLINDQVILRRLEDLILQREKPGA